MGGILGHEALQQRHRLVEAPLLDERARQVEGGRRGQRVRGPGVDELAERLGRLGVLLLELRPRQAVLRLGCERRGRIGLQDGLVRGPRVGETAETKEGFALPELHLERPARRWLKGLRAFEGLERRFVVADGQPGASEQQHGVGQTRVLGELLDESLQRTVLFGGFDGANTLVDTWEWDGTAWQQSAAGPAARDHVNMTYDPARQALVLYGAGETWQRSARVWSRTQGQGPTAPTAELTYDAVGASPLLYEITPGGALQLWGWNGSTWSRRD